MTEPAKQQKRDVRSSHPNWDKRIKRAHAQLNRKAKPSMGVPTSIWEWFAQTAKPIEIKARGGQDTDNMLIRSLRDLWRDTFKKKKKVAP